MKDVLLSVIIPTYNRGDRIVSTLESYKGQLDNKFEVVIVDDSENNYTKKAVDTIKKDLKFTIVYIRQREKGVSAARNIAIKKARADVLFFTGDDIIATKKLFKEHLDIHNRLRNVAVLGYTTWAPNLRVTEFMKFLMDKGHQFDYKGTGNGSFCNYRKFYTSNISLEKKWFENESFDESFLLAFEDIELGYRLQKRGLKIVFNKNAIAYHNHSVAEEEFYSRMVKAGKMSIVMYEKHRIKNPKQLVARANLVLFFLLPIRVYRAILKSFGLKSLLWKMNILYFTAQGIVKK